MAKGNKLVDRLVAKAKRSKEEIDADSIKRGCKQAAITAKQELFNKESQVEALRTKVEDIVDNPNASLSDKVNAKLELEAQEAMLEMMQEQNEEDFGA